MAFNRTTTVEGKKYRQLVESKWDPEKKQSRIHIIKHLGRVMEKDGKEKLIPSQVNYRRLKAGGIPLHRIPIDKT